MERLECPIRDYPWGSRELIARLQRRPAPSPAPEAELWVGAHPAAPSLVDGRPLPERISADPARVLGPALVDRFGVRLPFLMKLLAAAAPLSLQAHPDAAQARAGFAAEESAGVPRDAPHRRYSDPFHKPELLVAIGEFRALCGFRDPGDSAKLLARLGVPGLDPVVSALAGGDLAGATRWLLECRQRDRSMPARLVAEVAAAAAGWGPNTPYGLVGELAAGYPDDAGVLVALLLNQVTLGPGEAVFMPAGNLHAYLSGAGVEIMAASDNVLRGGLTGKHVDVDELLRVVRFEPLADPVRSAIEVAPGVATWPVPVDDFALHRVRLDRLTPDASVPVTGPSAVLCVDGEVVVDDGVGTVTLSPGEAAFGGGGGGAEAPPVAFRGKGEAFLASSG